jgi:hypothetical protein
MRERSGKSEWDENGRFDLAKYTADFFPDSIGTAFLRKARASGFNEGCFVALDECSSILVDATNSRCPSLLAKFDSSEVAPTVVHVRSADVISENGLHNSNLTGRSLDFYERLAPLLKRRGISNVSIITSFKHNTEGKHDGPRKFVENVQRAFESAGLQSNVVLTDDADTDFCLMANAQTFIPSRSGLSEAAAEVALAKGNTVLAFWRGTDNLSRELNVYDPELHERYIKMHPK